MLSPPCVDVVVVGAGIGGIGTVHELTGLGLTVVGIEAAGGVGGVWHHNRYPGARADVEGLWYCFHDPAIYRAWSWSERYPGQPEMLAYLEFVAERWDVSRHFRFSTRVTSAAWDEGARRWRVVTDDDDVLVARYLVMATGPLSSARTPSLPGLEDFRGLLAWTAHWPDPSPDLEGKRIGVVGTSASGVQVIPHLARSASQLFVFQRTPHFSAPANNGVLSADRVRAHVNRAETLWDEVTSSPGGTDIPPPAGPSGAFSDMERRALLEARWDYGAHAMTSVFSDQSVDASASEIVADFVREKIREKVKTPQLAERLVPRAYPFGTRRVAVDVDYYETFNRDNVTLVSLLDNPMEQITGSGVQLGHGHVDLDALVLATGFDAVTGALYAVDLVGIDGVALSARWRRGPMAYLGLMIHGFPNLFVPTGPGSPAGLANMFPCNEHHAHLIGLLVGHAEAEGHTKVEPRAEAQDRWHREVQELAASLLRYKFDNYLVHVNADDRSRVFMAYAGGFDRYVRICDEVVEAGFQGFEFC